jgi:hypothetical protein
MKIRNDSDPMEKVKSSTSITTDYVSRMAVLQSFSELGIGSVAHALQLPLVGQILSLNQIAILTWTCKLSENRKSAMSSCMAVACITSLLKSLAPVGKKLTPMLAISAQGFLYCIGLFLLGRHFLGVILGAALSSVWSFAQPILFAYFIFGNTLYFGAEKIWKDFSQAFSLPKEMILWILLGFVLIKVLLSILLSAYLWKSSWGLLAKYQNSVENLRQKTAHHIKPLRAQSHHPAWKQALLDLWTPWFVFSFLLTVLFLAFSQHEKGPEIWIYLLRPLAFGWLGFWLLRSLPSSFYQWVEKRFPGLEQARKQLQRSSEE